MLKKVPWTIAPLLAILLAGCAGIFGSESDAVVIDALPTTTPIPEADLPEPTPTPPPPPTVTPFPTVTPEGGVAEESEESTDAAEEESTESEETESEEAQSDAEPSVAKINPDIPLGPRAYISDFSQPGWTTIEEDTATVELIFGGYSWEIGPVDSAWINTGFIDMEDFYTQVTVDVSNCPSDAGYGLRFRLADSENYYFAVIWCNDLYSAAAEESGPIHYTLVSKTELPASVAGNAEALHVIGLLAQGSEFTLYMDGVPVSTFEDEDNLHASGDIAIWVLSPGNGTFRAVFDDWEIYELK